MLIDGHNLLHRAAFGFPARIRNRSGEDRTTLFGFFALLRAAARQLSSPEVIVIFDGAFGARDRRAMLEGYKPASAGLPADDFAELPTIVQALAALDIACIADSRYEADDVIATLADVSDDRVTVVLTTDKDFYQLVSDRFVVMNSAASPDRRFVTDVDVIARFGVLPRQWCDFKALTGDPSDGIPGIRGIGPRRAAYLLSDGRLLDDLRPSEGSPAWVSAAIKRIGDLLLWRDLMRLRRDVEFDRHLITGEPSRELPLAAAVLRELALW